MNVLYIIGNGFDLNIGLKTSYKDFYEYFKEQSNKNGFYDGINESIKGRIKRWIEDVEKTPFDTWADLESALGEYTDKFNSAKEFEDFYYKISDGLSKYIRLEEERLISSDKEKLKLSKDFIHPWEYLSNEDKNSISSYLAGKSNEEWIVNIINFNYSQTIEKLLNFTADKMMLLGNNSINSKNVNLSTIVHIHGVAVENSTILLGVNDISQIKNESFKTNEDLLDVIIKPKTNKGGGTGINETCTTFFNTANLICIFGSSLGETDKMWWELLGKQIKRDNCRIIYFVHERESIPKNRGQLVPRKIRECKENILSKTGMLQEKESIQNKIWVGYDKDMFKLNITKK
ncbi:MAG: bacteriophage abortive infection AbiH family protein [Tannerellaceae bacterium]|jgi:hypothetical protein|nr:bacteriophage abortive infection AbiH family protein [Tannerellaceae bacterium]